MSQLNAGAESIALDLKRAEGRELLLRLVTRADLVLEGFRPGVLERLGLGYEALRTASPRLVLLSISGYGGALAGRAGHDINYLARSGLLSLMGEMPPIQLADLAGGLFGAAGALAALVESRATACYNIYQTRDGGRITVGALEPKFWRAFCEAAGRPDWAERAFDPGAGAGPGRPYVGILAGDGPVGAGDPDACCRSGYQRE